MVIFPLAPDQTIAQMWSNGARGGNRATTRSICLRSVGVGQPSLINGVNVTLLHRHHCAVLSED